MAHLSAAFSTRLSNLVRTIYPDLDADILSSQIIEAFGPTKQRAANVGGRLRTTFGQSRMRC